MRASTIVGCLLLVCSAAAAQEIPAVSTTQSIGLFKNGVAVVRRTVAVPGPGIYRIENVPTPIHGTFFIESAATVTATVAMREVDLPASTGPGGDLQRDLAGKAVTVHFRDGSIPPVGGTVATFDRPSDVSSAPARFLVLQTPAGRSYVDASMIAHLAVAGDPGAPKGLRPVLLLTVDAPKSDRVSIAVLYLTTGIAWAPSYRLDVAHPNRLSIEQQAVIKNELEDIANVDLQLISGFPNIQFAHVTSPLSARTTWTTFFQQLNQRIAPSVNPAVVTQQVVTNVSMGGPDLRDLMAIPTESDVDVRYHSIGRRTLKRGEALAIVVAKAEAAYTRVVEWLIPDTRTADGRPIQEYGGRQQPSPYQEPAWDAVKFRNPLPFAMTTGPATITKGGEFTGQITSTFVNAGEETSLAVTKALSIRTRAVEQELPNQPRDIVRIGSREFRRTIVQGELSVANQRAQETTLIVRRQLSGDLTSADAEPKVALREEGAYSVNRRNELTWTIVLKPSEARTLTYQYSVLVGN